MNPFHTEIDQLAMGGTHGRLSDRRRLIHQRSKDPYLKVFGEMSHLTIMNLFRGSETTSN